MRAYYHKTMNNYNFGGEDNETAKQLCQKFPQVRRLSARFYKQAMVGVVRTLAFWLCKWHNTGNSMLARAQCPVGYEIGENLKCRLGKDGSKIQDYGVPCRCQKSSTHIGLTGIAIYKSAQSGGGFNSKYAQ
jgi:hypothetical protein